MSLKSLPPLQVGTTYRVSDFESLEFSSSFLTLAMTGEDTAILRLHLVNGTKLEIPLSDEDLRHHMRLLMGAFPKDAIQYTKKQWPNEIGASGAPEVG